MSALPQLPDALTSRYRPLETIGRGGAGTVVRAHDCETGCNVAIKIIDRGHLDDPRQRRVFLREARAIVRLEHPHVVRLLDFDLPREPPGEACLIMEYLAHGHLGVWRHVWPGWLPLLEALDGVLAALACAHARGIVHCDLKPENILFASGDDHSVKLVDFGVARLAAIRRHGSSHAESDALIGTPTYMAPEQAEGNLGALGPWTDLYALGVILFEILTGDPPFTATSIPTLLLQHLSEPTPRLVLRPEIPELEGIRELLTRLLAKAPWHRPRFAAHVRRALARLRPHAAALDARHPPPQNNPPNPATRSAPRTLNSFARVASEPPDEGVEVRWTPGLRMLRLKDPPIVGRDDLMAQLEVSVDATLASQQAHLVFLQGDAGMGTSRLAQALQEHLEESGRMQSWSCSYHIHIGGAPPGLRAAIESHHLCLGLTREACEGLLTARLVEHNGEGEPDPWELRNLLDWLRPLDGAGVLSDATLVGVSRRAILRAALEHPLYIWIDDLHHALDGPLLELLELLVSPDTTPLPCLVVATLRPLDADFDPTGRFERTLERLCAHSRAQRLIIPPLDDETLATMLTEAAGLDPRHAARLAHDARGNPSRALQAARAALELGALRDEPQLQLPAQSLTLTHDDDAFTERSRPVLVSPLASGRLLAGHVGELLNRLPRPDGLRALGMLALLGERTPLPLLARALELAWPGPWKTLESILDEAAHADLLAWSPDSTLGLDHRPLVRFLTEHLERRDERADAHRAAADALAECSPDLRAVAVSRARHHHRAGDLDVAWRLLQDALDDALRCARYAQALALSGELEDWAHAQDIPENHPRCGLIDRARALASVECGALDDAERHLERDLARGGAEPHALAERAWLQGRIHAGRAQLPDAIHAFEVAARSYAVEGDDHGLARCVLGLARAHRTLGQLPLAQREALHARGLFEQSNHTRGVGAATRVLGQIALLDARLDDAREHYQQALALFESIHDAHGSADIQRAFGGLLLEEGDTSAASQHLHRAIRTYEMIGDRQGLAHALRGLARAERSSGQLSHAHDHLDRAALLLANLGDSLGAADALLDLSSLERERGHTPQALTHIHDTLERYELAGDARGLANALLVLGNIHLDAAHHEDALDCHHRAFSLFTELGHHPSARLAQLNIGHALLELGRLSDAAEALALAASERTHDPDTAAVADAYLAILAARNHDLDALQEAFTRARESASTVSVGAELGHAFEQLATLLTTSDRALAREALEAARTRYLDAGRPALIRQLVHRHPALFSNEV